MKKRLLNTAFIYGILGLVAGAFYREYTKFIGFSGYTSLAFVHTHLLVLGMLVFLSLTSFSLIGDFTKNKYFKRFYCTYNTGLILTASMIFARGIYEVLKLESKALDASISGLAGIGHIVLLVGLVFLFTSLKEAIKEK